MLQSNCIIQAKLNLFYKLVTSPRHCITMPGHLAQLCVGNVNFILTIFLCFVYFFHLCVYSL